MWIDEREFYLPQVMRNTPRSNSPVAMHSTSPSKPNCTQSYMRAARIILPVSYTHLTLPTTPYV